MTRPDEGPFTQAAFRQVSTGHVVRTGAFHDLSFLPDGEDADLDDWEAGFTDRCGSFFTRKEAAAAIGVSGSLESRSYFAGEATPTLEAGHEPSWKDRRAARARRAAPGGADAAERATFPAAPSFPTGNRPRLRALGRTNGRSSRRRARPRTPSRFRGPMTIRVLSFTLAAAWMAAALPAHAYDPSDPRGPSPDDPSAWRHIGERAAAPVAPAPEPCAAAVADVSLGRSVHGLDCRCAAVQALPGARGEDRAAQPSPAGGGAAETYR